jgi:hypothetical protein
VFFSEAEPWIPLESIRRTTQRHADMTVRWMAFTRRFFTDESLHEQYLHTLTTFPYRWLNFAEQYVRSLPSWFIDPSKHLSVDSNSQGSASKNDKQDQDSTKNPKGGSPP